MISLSYLFEILGDPKWEERLRNKSYQYHDAAYTKGLDKPSVSKLHSMGHRADLLAGRAGGYGGDWYGFQGIHLDRKSPFANYQKHTERLYPNRAIVRKENSRALLPKSLRK